MAMASLECISTALVMVPCLENQTHNKQLPRPLLKVFPSCQSAFCFTVPYCILQMVSPEPCEPPPPPPPSVMAHQDLLAVISTWSELEARSVAHSALEALLSCSTLDQSQAHTHFIHLKHSYMRSLMLCIKCLIHGGRRRRHCCHSFLLTFHSLSCRCSFCSLLHLARCAKRLPTLQILR